MKPPDNRTASLHLAGHDQATSPEDDSLGGWLVRELVLSAPLAERYAERILNSAAMERAEQLERAKRMFAQDVASYVMEGQPRYLRSVFDKRRRKYWPKRHRGKLRYAITSAQAADDIGDALVELRSAIRKDGFEPRNVDGWVLKVAGRLRNKKRKKWKLKECVDSLNQKTMERPEYASQCSLDLDDGKWLVAAGEARHQGYTCQKRAVADRLALLGNVVRIVRERCNEGVTTREISDEFGSVGRRGARSRKVPVYIVRWIRGSIFVCKPQRVDEIIEEMNKWEEGRLAEGGAERGHKGAKAKSVIPTLVRWHVPVLGAFLPEQTFRAMVTYHICKSRDGTWTTVREIMGVKSVKEYRDTWNKRLPSAVKWLGLSRSEFDKVVQRG